MKGEKCHSSSHMTGYYVSNRQEEIKGIINSLTYAEYNFKIPKEKTLIFTYKGRNNSVRQVFLKA